MNPSYEDFLDTPDGKKMAESLDFILRDASRQSASQQAYVVYGNPYNINPCWYCTQGNMGSKGPECPLLLMECRTAVVCTAFIADWLTGLEDYVRAIDASTESICRHMNQKHRKRGRNNKWGDI